MKNEHSSGEPHPRISIRFKPLELMLARVTRFGSDSDSALFSELLYAGEFILKVTTAAFVSGIEDDREHHRYRLMHSLVRADGTGDWARSLDETLTGPPSQELTPALSDTRRSFTERVGMGHWQFEAVRDLHRVLSGVYDGAQPLSEKVAFRQWFQIFSELRNKTRGHGALTPATCARLVGHFNTSIQLVADHNPVFSLPWAYLQRNLSGKYRVIDLGGDPSFFAKLKTGAALKEGNFADGVYIYAGSYRRVELTYADLDVSDFYLPNGAFRNGTYELHSLITDSRLTADGVPYLAAASERPQSETEGKGELDILGQVFSNLPATTLAYVSRPALEIEIKNAIMNDRHPIVTLVGRGGVGKTSLALQVLREIANTDRFGVIVWFSSRDIDLTLTGPKPVMPHVLTDREIADEYLSLVGAPTQKVGEKIKSTTYFAEHLRHSPLGPTLFVFDNFETVRSPIDLFQWLDINIRLPNKAVITTRFRDFKADYPIEVSGMEQNEADALVTQTAISLGISDMMGGREREMIIEQSDGHPYVMKIMLGEIANAKSFGKPSNLIARKDDVLDALFERTYANLSPVAARIFLMLSGWRSIVPQLAVEAVLLRHVGGDPETGVDQLVRMSLIERVPASDGNDFLEVPLAAALFGRRKLKVSPNRTMIEGDIRFLHDLGASSNIKEGIKPRIEAFFRTTARNINNASATLEEMRPVLEFLARGYAHAWLLLSQLEQEVSGQAGRGRAAEYVRRYLETQPPAKQRQSAWQQLFSLYRSINDVVGALGAFMHASETSEPPMNEISAMANWLNTTSEWKTVDVLERKALIGPLLMLMELRISEATATDLSRLAWLYLNSGEIRRARLVADLGLKREPDNVHCQRIEEKLAGYN